MDSSENPYASPAAEISPLDALDRHDYRSNGQLVKWLTVLLVVDIAFYLLSAIFGWMEATVFAKFAVLEEFDDLGALAFYLAMGATGLLYIPLSIFTIVLFCVWLYRANRNARALGATGMRFTPGWSVGWFFIPIMHWFRPYQATREIYRASDPDADAINWVSSPTPVFLGLWWAFWIIAGMLGCIEFFLVFRDLQSVSIAGAWMSVVNGLWELPTALLAILVVRAIHNRQQRKAAK